MRDVKSRSARRNEAHIRDRSAFIFKLPHFGILKTFILQNVDGGVLIFKFPYFGTLKCNPKITDKAWTGGQPRVDSDFCVRGDAFLIGKRERETRSERLVIGLHFL